MVLTSPEYRRRGLAKRLLTTVLGQADRMGIETVKLDATEQGRPLYEQFGFRREQEIERWSRPGDGTEPPPFPRNSEPAWSDSDALAFGADRSPLLRRLAQRNPPVSRSQSYVFAREGRVTAYLGPCVSPDPAAAGSLVRRAMQDAHCGWSWDLLASHRDAVALARDLGFAARRHLVRMARGKTLHGNDNAVYAIAGFELG
jgi:hypothetical protein